MGWDGGLAGGRGEKVVWGGWNPKMEAADIGTLPPWFPPKPASRLWGLVKKSRCLLKASKAGIGGRLAKMDLGSNFSSGLSLSSLIKCLGSWNIKKTSKSKSKAYFVETWIKWISFFQKIIIRWWCQKMSWLIRSAWRQERKDDTTGCLHEYGVTCIWKMSLLHPAEYLLVLSYSGSEWSFVIKNSLSLSVLSYTKREVNYWGQ